MALEVGTRINDLVATNPLSSDPAGQGDDHLRLIKACVQGSIPNMGGILGQVRSQDTAVSLSSIWNTSTILVTNSATATVVLTLPPASSITTGFYLDIITRPAATVSLLPSGVGVSINGAASLSIPQDSHAKVSYDGADWWAAVSPAGGILTGPLVINGAVSISGALTLASTLTVSAATSLLGTLSVAGAATLASTLSVSGAVNFNTTLNVQGATTLSGAATLKGTVSVGGAATLGSTLSVSGAAHMNTTLSVGGAATLGSTLSVSGAAVFTGTVANRSAVTMDSTLSVSGAAVFKGAVSIGGAAQFASAVSIGGGLTLSSTLTVSGTVALLGLLQLGGNLNLNNGIINFPAVQNPSAGANSLDDYEEGTWTPFIDYAVTGNLNVVYSLQSGTYTKIGRHVTACFTLTTSTYTHTTSSGTMVISGFPFSSTFAAHGTLNYEGMLISTSPNYDGPVLRLATGTTAALTKSGINSNAMADLDQNSHTSGVNVQMNGTISYGAA